MTWQSPQYNPMSGQTTTLQGTTNALYGPNSIVGGQNAQLQNGGIWNPAQGGTGQTPPPGGSMSSVMGGSSANRTMYGDQPSMTSSPSSAYNSTGYLSNKYTSTGGRNPLDSKMQNANPMQSSAYGPTFQPGPGVTMSGPGGLTPQSAYQPGGSNPNAGPSALYGPMGPPQGQDMSWLDQGVNRSSIQQLPNTGSDMYTNQGYPSPRVTPPSYPQGGGFPSPKVPRYYDPQQSYSPMPAMSPMPQAYSQMSATSPMTQASYAPQGYDSGLAHQYQGGGAYPTPGPAVPSAGMNPANNLEDYNANHGGHGGPTIPGTNIRPPVNPFGIFGSKRKKDRTINPYDETADFNAPAPEGWPEGLPAPPAGVLPGTQAFHRWLKANHIEPTSRLTQQIVQQLFMQQHGAGADPRGLAPWGTDPGGYEQYMQDYLSGLGLGLENQPGSFRQDLYGQILGDAQAGGMQAAGMIEDFDPTQAAGYDTLAQYMQMQQGNLDKYGGYMGFDPKPLQAAGIAQAEIARNRAEQAFKNQFAGSGLLGQANSSYAAAPLYADYMSNRVNAMQQPFNMAAQLGVQGVGTTMGALNDLYGLGQTADIARADAFGQLYGQGLSTGASTGIQAAGLDQQQFQAMQDLYSQFPSEGYGMAVDANAAWNNYVMQLLAASNGQYLASEQIDSQNRNDKLAENIALSSSIQGGGGGGGSAIGSVIGATA